MQQARIRRSASSTSQPNEEQPLVMIVDDDAAIREALHELLLSAGMQPVCFASTRDLLNTGMPERPSCLILDVRMPGSSGLDLQTHLAAKGDAPPIIFLTGHGDIPMTVQAMKLGAVDFLTKPVRDQTLLDAVTAAIERDIARRREAQLVKKYIEGLRRLPHGSVRSSVRWRSGASTSRSPSILASARLPSSSTAAMSCGRCRPLQLAGLSALGKPCPLICAKREQTKL